MLAPKSAETRETHNKRVSMPRALAHVHARACARACVCMCVCARGRGGGITIALLRTIEVMQGAEKVERR